MYKLSGAVLVVTGVAMIVFGTMQCIKYRSLYREYIGAEVLGAGLGFSLVGAAHICRGFSNSWRFFEDVDPKT